MMHIEKETYKIPEKNYYKTKNSKTQILIGTSLRKDSNHITRLQHKDYGKTKKWCTYSISRDGNIYQHYDDKYYTDFVGIKEGDKHSISIVLENMGALHTSPTGKYVNWLNEVCEDENIVEREWYGYNFWEHYPEIQIESLIDLCKMISQKHNIPEKFIEFNHYHKEIHKFKGIVFKGNYIEDSSDMNPLLEIPKLEEMLQK